MPKAAIIDNNKKGPLGVCAADGLLIQRRCEVSRIAESGLKNRRFRRVEAAEAELTLWR